MIIDKVYTWIRSSVLVQSFQKFLVFESMKFLLQAIFLSFPGNFWLFLRVPALISFLKSKLWIEKCYYVFIAFISFQLWCSKVLSWF